MDYYSPALSTRIHSVSPPSSSSLSSSLSAYFFYFLLDFLFGSSSLSSSSESSLAFFFDLFFTSISDASSSSESVKSASEIGSESLSRFNWLSYDFLLVLPLLAVILLLPLPGRLFPRGDQPKGSFLLTPRRRPLFPISILPLTIASSICATVTQ